MTKQPPFVSKLRLSRVCRWLLALGMVKLGILVAMVGGYPLPELSLDFGTKPLMTRLSTTSTDVKSASMHQVENDSGNLPRTSSVDDVLSRMASDAASAKSPATLKGTAEPQGAAAARAAAAMHPGTPPSMTPTIAQEAAAPTLTPEPTHISDAAPGVTWWENLLHATRLPVPRLGSEQAAHAATLDMPPPPHVSVDQAASPFTPPAQNIPRGQNPDGSPLPPRSTTARPLPAGTAGPQLSSNQDTLPSVLVPNDRPPTPRLDAYVPPEDPNRQQQELTRREQEVLILKQQMEQRLQELQQAEQKVQDMLLEAKELEEKKIANLSAMYINMKPKVAAKAVEALEDRIAVKILSSMTPKQSGEILTYMDPTRTAKLTELISRMRIAP